RWFASRWFLASAPENRAGFRRHALSLARCGIAGDSTAIRFPMAGSRSWLVGGAVACGGVCVDALKKTLAALAGVSRDVMADLCSLGGSVSGFCPLLWTGRGAGLAALLAGTGALGPCRFRPQRGCLVFFRS